MLDPMPWEGQKSVRSGLARRGWVTRRRREALGLPPEHPHRFGQVAGLALFRPGAPWRWQRNARPEAIAAWERHARLADRAHPTTGSTQAWPGLTLPCPLRRPRINTYSTL